MKLGFIGLGNMGEHMAHNFLKAGYELYVSDVVKEPVDRMVERGAIAKDSPYEMAKEVDILFTSLPNSAIVEAVILGENGALAGLKEGSKIIDLSSITPKTIQKIYEIAAEKNVDVMDAPVSGGTAGAEKGTLTIMLGGKEEVFEEVKEVLNAIGKKLIYVGGIGAGNSAKLVNNLLLGVNMVAASEALALAVRLGIKPEVIYDIVSQSSGSSYALTAKYNKFIAPGEFDPGFAIDLQHKDLELAVETAKSLRVPLVCGNMAQQMFEIARAEGLGGKDISAVINLYENWMDVEVRE